MEVTLYQQRVEGEGGEAQITAARWMFQYTCLGLQVIKEIKQIFLIKQTY